MKYNGKQVSVLAARSLELAKSKLAELPVYCGHEPNFTGLHGWIYEQTIQFCLKEELAEQGLMPETKEQATFGGKAKADLRLARILIEVKAKGLFGMNDVQRYGKYRKQAEGNGYRYLFVTASETYEPYLTGIVEALGHNNVFVLDQPGEWERLVGTIVGELDPTRTL